VSKEKFGIGYGGAAYAKGIKILKVKKDAASPAINPEKTTVLNGTYPLARPLFFYLRAKQTGEIKSFIDWVAVGRRPGDRREGRLLPGEVEPLSHLSPLRGERVYRFWG
jgi:hypothetical protein